MKRRAKREREQMRKGGGGGGVEGVESVKIRLGVERNKLGIFIGLCRIGLHPPLNRSLTYLLY